ncbi:MAG: phosphate acetyltransferase [Acidobacteria bacterium]|nr:phosphate acetyltransferase [Acidobacteriota bacterium]
MAENLYVTSTEASSGKSVVSLGLMEMLLRNVKNVAFFRPLINVEDGTENIDHDLLLLSTYFKLETPYKEMFGFTTKQALEYISSGRYEQLMEEIVAKYNSLADKYDFVLVEGTDFEGSTSAFELDINADIINNLGCPVILVATERNKSEEETIRAIEMSYESMCEKSCNIVATVINRTRPGSDIVRKLKEKTNSPNAFIFSLPEEKTLGSPTVRRIAEALDAQILYGENQLNRHVEGFGVAAMQLRNCLDRMKDGDLVITPGDRADVIVACLASLTSSSMPNISGLLLTGGLMPEEPILKLIEGFPNIIPVLIVQENTFEAARKADKVHAIIAPTDTRKITKALALFEQNIDVAALRDRIIQTKITVITPKMFEFRLIQKARTHKQHIVLPEGEEERILRAAYILIRRNVVDITLLGKEDAIKSQIRKFDLHMNGVSIIDPQNSDLAEDFIGTYHELRKHKNIRLEDAHDIMTDLNYFGTMMVYKGIADGMVSGSTQSTRNTLRPSFEFIKTKPGFNIISSVFFMCLEDRVLVYGDCAVNPDPNAEQLAEIAISAAQTAKTFGIEPRVAMLSYSTGESGVGEDVDKVREATKIAKKMAEKTYPGLKIEGPIQYDAAIDPGVARTKLPDSEVAGKATVYIFPDLNTGNNTYKAVQRSANAVAIGPVLQGLNKPINDLSRGCTVADIVNTVAITAIQAQAEKGLLS